MFGEHEALSSHGIVDLRGIERDGTIDTWGFPKIRDTFLGGPKNKDHRYWGPLISGNYHLHPS